MHKKNYILKCLIYFFYIYLSISSYGSRKFQNHFFLISLKTKKETKIYLFFIYFIIYIYLFKNHCQNYILKFEATPPLIHQLLPNKFEQIKCTTAPVKPIQRSKCTAKNRSPSHHIIKIGFEISTKNLGSM